MDGHTSRDDVLLAIGERIVQARQEAGLTQVELADLLGVSQRSMQAYENGEVQNVYRRLREIGRILEKPMEYLLYGGELVTAPDERLHAIEESLDRLTKAVESLSRKLK